MKVIIPGHLYELENFENKMEPGQPIQFIQKEADEDGDGTLFTVSDGTTNEEVLRMLIDRMNYLDRKFPCRENIEAINKLDEALMWLEKRTRDRVARDVEGKAIA